MITVKIEVKYKAQFDGLDMALYQNVPLRTAVTTVVQIVSHRVTYVFLLRAPHWVFL